MVATPLFHLFDCSDPHQTNVRIQRAKNQTIRSVKPITGCVLIRAEVSLGQSVDISVRANMPKGVFLLNEKLHYTEWMRLRRCVLERCTFDGRLTYAACE